MTNYYERWKCPDKLNYLDFIIKNDWKFILSYLNLKDFIKITKDNLLTEQIIKTDLCNLFDWTFNKSFDEIKVIIIIERFYPYNKKLIRDIDPFILENKNILFMPLFYYKMEKNKSFFLNFVISILNDIIIKKKVCLVYLIPKEYINYLTNPRKFIGNNIIIEGESLVENKNSKMNLDIFSLINLVLKKNIIDIF